MIEAVFSGNANARDSFLRSVGPTSPYPSPFLQGDVADYLRDESRNAIAHVVRYDPANTSIDPDLPSDRERLDLDGNWMRNLARRAITSKWPTPVALTPRGPAAGQ